MTIDLEFDTRTAADTMSQALRMLWGRAEAEGLIGSQRVSILEPVESQDY